VAVWAWEGRTRAGEVRKGELEAANEQALNQALRGQNIALTSARRKAQDLKLPEWLQFGSGVGTKDLVIFTRQFATMIDAGLPLVQCLQILAEQTENKNLAKVLFNVKGRVESGSTFADALRQHPRVFNELYVNLVAAGEVGGILDTILNRLGGYIEKAEKLKRQVKGALTYPIAVLIVAAIVVTVLLVKVIPTFKDMFAAFGHGSLPAPTQFVITMSEGFIKHLFAIFFVTALIATGFVMLMRTEGGKMGKDKLLLRLPLFGMLLRKVAVARFCRTLSTLLSSGVSILDALDIVAKTAGNRVVRDAIYLVRQKISEGKDMATPLMDTKVFPPMVVQMIGVGEQTGAMDTMLGKIADFYEEEVDVTVAALTSLMEPMIMVFLGTIVGGLIISMYLPIFTIADSIKAQ
jgi:type IV pilus assembly protein PilC